MSSSASPIPGWYVDPHSPHHLRYWDGAAWTTHVAPAAAAPSDPWERSTSMSPLAAGAGRTGLSKRAKAGLVGGIALVVLIVAGGVVAVINPALSARRAMEADAAARADAFALGMEISQYFYAGSGPAPEISVKDGTYVVVTGPNFFPPPGARPTETLIPVSPGVEFGGVSGGSPQWWCVWVTAPEGEVKDYRSTPLVAVEEGSC